MKLTLQLNEWVMVLTTIEPVKQNTEAILQLYRIGWQIESYIKRLKGLLKLGELRSRFDSKLSRVSILGRILFALLMEQRNALRFGAEWQRMTENRAVSSFGVWKLSITEMIEAMLASESWEADEWQWKLKKLSERKRKRKLQHISKEMWKWLRGEP